MRESWGLTYTNVDCVRLSRPLAQSDAIRSSSVTHPMLLWDGRDGRKVQLPPQHLATVKTGRRARPTFPGLPGSGVEPRYSRAWKLGACRAEAEIILPPFALSRV